MKASEVGKLTEDQKVILNAWVAKTWPTEFRCPVCKSTNWAILEYIIDFKPYTGGLLMFGGLPSFPHVGITSECGYTVFLNAITIGVVKVQLPVEETENGG